MSQRRKETSVCVCVRVRVCFLCAHKMQGKILGGYMHKGVFLKFLTELSLVHRGSVAEWSKALVLGTSPKGRGFESHRCQKYFKL